MLKHDTPLPDNVEANDKHASDPQRAGSGGSSAPGGSAAGHKTAEELSHGQETYPGSRAGGQENLSQTPPSGDVDPGSTESAKETGQDGDKNQKVKESGNAWNG